MDSIDQTYQSGKLSSSKSNNSIDYVGNPNKRDSAYGSFSTSFITPEHNLSKNSSVSSENILYQINEWDNDKQTHGKPGHVLPDSRRADDKQGYHSPSMSYETNKQRTDDNVESRHCGRSNFGPVWHVPDKKKPASSPPPPPPPLRSDSYAVTKSHEKPAPTFSETSTQHFNVANRSHSRSDWNSEVPDYQQRLLRAPDRRISNSSYRSEINLDQISSYKEKYQNSVPHSSRLQSSQSTSDVRFAHPSYHHRRQFSDESTFFPNTRVSQPVKAQPQQVAFSSGGYEVAADQPHVYNAHHTRATSSSECSSGGRVRGDSNAPSRITSAGSKQPSQVTISHHQYKEEYSKSEVYDMRSTPQDSGALRTGYSLPQQNSHPSPENCDMYSSKGVEKKGIYSNNNERMKSRKNSDYHEGHYSNHHVSQHDLTNKQMSPNKYGSNHDDYCWNDQEDSKITPQITPMLHSLTQEGRNRSVSSPDTNEKYIIPDPTKQGRRSDRFATTLRNEIQQRRARLQKSKSTATLSESNEGDSFENWSPTSPESITPSSDGAFSNTYKNNLKEAQARVLRATSFKRRDLEPVIVDSSLSPEQRNQGYNVSKHAFHTDVAYYPGEQIQPKQIAPGSISQNITRIGGRKRFTAKQKLKSYSEPEKMNEVGIYEDSKKFDSDISQEPVGSFADRWKFFEETSKSAQLMPASKLTPQTFTEDSHEINNVGDNENIPRESWLEKRSRAASLGAENLINRDKNLNDHHHGPNYRSFDTIQPPQRLGTFAEYQASWKEQKKPLERKNSGRCHSADNILDAGLDQNERSQYIHERSRSSPTTDFYAQVNLLV